jgi:hypothetical protein
MMTTAISGVATRAATATAPMAQPSNLKRRKARISEFALSIVVVATNTPVSLTGFT